MSAGLSWRVDSWRPLPARKAAVKARHSVPAAAMAQILRGMSAGFMASFL